MPFDPTTAIPVIKREDGLFEKDTFNPSNARPIPQLTEGEKRYVPALSDQERARALVELTALEKGQQISKGTKVMWALTSDKARAGVAAVVNTLATGGLYPAVQAVRGAADDTGDYDLFDRVTRGVFNPEDTARLTDKLVVKDEPEWAKITRTVSEDVLSYGVAGIAQSAAKTQLLARDVARKIETAADAYATQKVGSLAGEGIATSEQAVLTRKIADVKDGFKQAMILKLKAIDLTTGKTNIQGYAERRSIIGMIGDELEARGVSAGLSIKNVKPGQVVSFKSGDKELIGQVLEIQGKRVTIDLAGKQVVASLSQLSLPELPKEELTKIYHGTDKIFDEFDVSKSADGSIWFTDNKDKIIKGEVSATGKGQIVERFINENKLKLGGWEEYDKYSMDELISKGYDGIKLVDNGETTYQIFNPEKLQKTAKTTLPLKELPKAIPASKVKSVVRENTGQIKDQGQVVSERTAFIQSLKDRVKASKQAEKFTKQDIFDTQSAFTELVKKSGLEPQDQAKFINEIRNIQSAEDLSVAMKPSYWESGKNAGQIKDIGLEEKMNILIDKMERKNISADIKDVNTKGIAIEYQQAIENIQDSIDLKFRSKKTLENRERMRDFVSRMKAEGKEIPIPEDRLAILDKKALNDLTVDELKEIRDSVEQLAKLGKTKQVAREAVYATKKENISQSLLNDIKAINSKKLPDVEIGAEPNKMAKRYVDLMNYVTKTKVGLTPIEGLADVTGMQKMKKVMDKNFGDYLSFNDKDFKAWDDLTKKMTEGQLKKIGTYAAAQQEGGVERLLNSGLSEEAINSIVLTPEELKAYNFVRETFDKHYPEVARFSKEVYNEEVGKVDNYVSFLSDYEKMSDLEMYDRFGQRPEEAINRRTKTVEQGFRKERSNISNIKLETNIDKIFHRHLDDVAYMLTMGRDIKMFSEIVNTPEIRDALGDVGSMAWLQYLDLMARKGGVDSAKRIALLDIVRRNVGVGVLAFRASSALVQVSSFGDTMATIGPEWATRGATNIATSPEWRNFIMDNFPEIRKAVGDDVAFREFGENMFSGAIKVGMKPLQVMDGLMRSTAASGAYEKIAKEKGVPVDLENPDQEIIQEATKLMRQSQGSSYFKDQPLSITTGYGLTDNTSLNKTILQFQSFMLGRWDNINRQIWRLGIKEKDFGKAFSSLFWLFTFGLGTEEFIRRGVKKASGRKNNSIAQGMITNAIQTIPLVGQVASSISYGSNPVPVIKATQDAIDALKQSNEAKTAKTRKKARIKAVGAGATLLGVPGATTATQLIVGKNKKKHTIR